MVGALPLNQNADCLSGQSNRLDNDSPHHPLLAQNQHSTRHVQELQRRAWKRRNTRKQLVLSCKFPLLKPRTKQLPYWVVLINRNIFITPRSITVERRAGVFVELHPDIFAAKVKPAAVVAADKSAWFDWYARHYTLRKYTNAFAEKQCYISEKTASSRMIWHCKSFITDNLKAMNNSSFMLESNFVAWLLFHACK